MSRLFHKLKADITPVLVFTHQDGYVLENFGNGPALDVVVFNAETGGSEFVRSVSCYPMSKGSRNDMIWVKQPERLGVTYKDLYGNQYTSFCQNDRIEFKKGKLIANEEFGLKLESERAVRLVIRRK